MAIRSCEDVRSMCQEWREWCSHACDTTSPEPEASAPGASSLPNQPPASLTPRTAPRTLRPTTANPPAHNVSVSTSTSREELHQGPVDRLEAWQSAMPAWQRRARGQREPEASALVAPHLMDQAASTHEHTLTQSTNTAQESRVRNLEHQYETMY